MEKEIASKDLNQIHTLAFDDSDEIEIRLPYYRSFLIFTEILSVCRIRSNVSNLTQKVQVARNLKNLIEKSPEIFIEYTNITYYIVKYTNNIY